MEIPKVRVARWIAFVILFLAAGGTLSAQTFVFDLRGAQEVPPNPSTATGGCMGVLDQGAATFDLTCVHNVIGATLMHVHQGAIGVNGPPIFDLGDPASPVTATWTGMTPANIADLLAGNLYINIHTAGRPDGEIRGQILTRTVDTVAFALDGGQVVPPVTTASTGACTADLNDAATALDVDCTHNVPAPTEAHLHDAPPGENGPQVFAFPSPASPISGSAPLTAQQVASFAAGFLYVDIHSTDVPTGEIRGQAGALPTPPTVGTIRIQKTTHPAGGAGFGFTDDVPGSPGTFTLDDGQVQTFTNVPPGTYGVTEDDPATTPGAFALTELACDDGDSSGDLVTRTATIALDAGETVTCTFVNTEVPPGANLFVFHLSGDQEVPPVPTTARGGCAGIFDSGASELTLLCTHDVADPTLMHIHRAPAGTNGPIVFDLGDPTSPVQATWSGMMPADVADLFAGNLYVNIHTGGRPGGAIRGQILERTVDTVAFPLHGAQVVPPSSTSATGSCLADLNDLATQLDVDCTHDVPDPEQAHVHDAPALANGPVIFTFSSPASPLSGSVPMTPRFLADFAAGFLYVDVHGAADEIRGQMVTAPSLTIDDVSLAEGDAGTTAFTFTITLSSAVTYDVPVTWETVAGTAAAGSDYTSVPPTVVTIPAGSLSVTVTVDVTGDLVFEPNETFTVQLSNPVGATLADGEGLGTIVNDDAPPAVTLGLTGSPMAEASGVATVTASLSAASSQPVTVNLAFGGTATATSDYTSSAASIVIPAGSSSGSITLTAVQDTVDEPDETIVVDIDTVAGGTEVTPQQVTATITDDEGAPTLSIDDVTQAEGDSGATNFVFTVTLTGSTAQTVMVNYASADGSATAGSDYTPTSGTLTFAPGVTTQTITVPVTGDTVIEPDETFTVTLSGATNAAIGTATGTGTIVNDEAAAELSIVKSAAAQAFTGESVTFTILVANAGPDAATNVVVTDPLPAGATFESATPTQGSCSGTTTIVCNLGTINSGASATVTLVVTAPATPQDLVNTASIDSGAADPDGTNDSDTATVEILDAAAIPVASPMTMVLLALALALAGIVTMRRG